MAGAINGMVLNQLATIKYQVWNDKSVNSFWSATRLMVRTGGLRAFTRGIWATGLRDITFGVCYEVGRTELRHFWNVPPHVANMGESRFAMGFF